MQYTPAQATLAAQTRGQLTVVLDQPLVSIAYPTVESVLVGETPHGTQQVLLEHARYAMIVENTSTFAVYDELLRSFGFTFLRKATDPLKTVRLYSR
jgi:hypothetical protein